jgi:hypothetical protein
VVVRDAVVSDIEPIAKEMRISDRVEVWSSHRHAPLKAMTMSFYQSALCYTIEHQGKRVGMFGVSPHSFLGDSGNIWLLCTKDFDKCHRKLIRHSKGFIKLMLNHYPKLENFVDARNIKSVAWLKFCGADIEEAKPFGVDNLPFHKFTFKRGAYALAS